MRVTWRSAIRLLTASALLAAMESSPAAQVSGTAAMSAPVNRASEWGFTGFVLSDLGAIRHLCARHLVAATPKDAVCRALNSVVDVHFYDFDHATFQGPIREGPAHGSLHLEALDRTFSGVLRVKFLLGLSHRPMVDTALNARVGRSQEHLDLSLESARPSTTLLRNENHQLPFSKSTHLAAVIGPNSDHAQCGDYADEAKGARVSARDGIRILIGTDRVTFDDGKDIASPGRSLS